MVKKNNAGVTVKANTTGKRKARRIPTYSTYVHKVLQQISPRDSTGITVSSKSIQLLNTMLTDLEKRLTDKSVEIARHEKKATLSYQHVDTATRITLPLELAQHATHESSKAVRKYNDAT